MLNIELLYDKDCPNVPATRANLREALAEARLPDRWAEWEQSAPEAPPYVKSYGSPTVLVNGRDVAGTDPAEGVAWCCRLYESADPAQRGVTPVALIAGALERAVGPGSTRGRSGITSRRSDWKHSVAALPALVVAWLPSVTCPVCWPAYAAVLSAMGLPFIAYDGYLLPLMAAALLVAVGSLGFQGWKRGAYGPTSLGVAAAGAIILGRFVLQSDVWFYVGVGLLIVASMWNAWPRRRAAAAVCPSCVPAGDGFNKMNAKET